MQASVQDIPRESAAKLFPSLLTPRPVVLIGTVDPDTGRSNLATFSSVSFVANNPPLIVISISKRHGEDKDTFTNAVATNELVINMLSRSHSEQAIAVAATPERSVDDYFCGGFARADFEGFAVGRVADSPAALGCRVVATHDLLPSKSVLLIAEVKSIYCDDQFLVVRADFMASVGGERYISLNGSDQFNLPRTWE
jgi:flavin reductase (DIM6/NTAB) family NADH-FMN oxidoreductase RutF